MQGAAAVGCCGRFHGDDMRTRAGAARQDPVSASVPLISSGPIFVAQAMGFFEKLNLDVELKYFADGALAIPALIAGELDTTVVDTQRGIVQRRVARRALQARFSIVVRKSPAPAR